MTLERAARPLRLGEIRDRVPLMLRIGSLLERALLELRTEGAIVMDGEFRAATYSPAA